MAKKNIATCIVYYYTYWAAIYNAVTFKFLEELMSNQFTIYSSLCTLILSVLALVVL